MNLDGAFLVRNFVETLRGIPTTLLITLLAMVIGVPLAFFIAQARMKKIPVLSQILTVYISFMRGTPIMVQIFLVYNGVPQILKSLNQSLGWSIDVYSISPLFYAVLIFGLNASANYSEMWKAGLSGVGTSQLEAAQMVGLSGRQAYMHIIIPQAIGIAAPSFCSSTLTMLKNTSLVFAMSVMDIAAYARRVAGMEYKYVEGYLDMLAAYIIVCSLIEFGFKRFEKYITAYKYRTTGKTSRKNAAIQESREVTAI